MIEKMKAMAAVALLMAGALTAAADEYPAYFYWNVSDSVADFSYAQLRLSGGDTYFKIGDTDYTMVGAETTGGATLGQTTGTVAANLGSYATSDYSFLVEVFGEDDGLLAYSDAMSSYANVSLHPSNPSSSPKTSTRNEYSLDAYAPRFAATASVVWPRSPSAAPTIV